MKNKQLLHIVIGGELKELGGTEFRDLKKVELVGAYPDYASAKAAWKGRAQSTVDNALMRFFVLHAHRLLDPSTDDEPVEITDAMVLAAARAYHPNFDNLIEDPNESAGAATKGCVLKSARRALQAALVVQA